MLCTLYVGLMGIVPTLNNGLQGWSNINLFIPLEVKIGYRSSKEIILESSIVLNLYLQTEPTNGKRRGMPTFSTIRMSLRLAIIDKE